MTVDFEDADDGTKVTITHEGMMSEGIAEGTEQGWNGMLENLEKALS